jgi:hypothetical protein
MRVTRARAATKAVAATGALAPRTATRQAGVSPNIFRESADTIFAQNLQSLSSCVVWVDHAGVWRVHVPLIVIFVSVRTTPRLSGGASPGVHLGLIPPHTRLASRITASMLLPMTWWKTATCDRSKIPWARFNRRWRPRPPLGETQAMIGVLDVRIWHRVRCVSPGPLLPRRASPRSGAAISACTMPRRPRAVTDWPTTRDGPAALALQRCGKSGLSGGCNVPSQPVGMATRRQLRCRGPPGGPTRPLGWVGADVRKKKQERFRVPKPNHVRYSPNLASEFVRRVRLWTRVARFGDDARAPCVRPRRRRPSPG